MELTEFLFYTVTFITVILIGQFHWSRRRLYQFAAKLPGPPVLPFIGNGLQWMCKKEEFFDVFLKLTVPYTSPSRIWLGPKLMVFISDPNQIQTVLLSNKITNKAFFYKYFEPFLGNGLFTASGSINKQHKKLLQPLFSQRSIEGYSLFFQKHANEFVKKIQSYVDGPEFDILTILQHTAFQTTMDILLEDENQHSIDNEIIPKYIRRFYDIFFERVTTFWMDPDFIYRWTSLYEEQEKMKKFVKIVINEIMETKVPEVLDRTVKNRLKPLEKKQLKPPSMLEMIIEMLMENADYLTVEDTIDHLMTFFATSQDTQSSAIGFTCMLLGSHPHIQDLVVNELKEVLGDRKELHFHDVSKLKYLEMCIKESLRLYPIGPIIMRETNEDFKLDKYTIPKGVTVGISIFSAHRHSEHWEKPNDFYPEHFTSEAVKKRHSYAFVPFSVGPRKCIAQQFSYTNMKIVIGNILLNYRVECIRDMKNIKLMTDISIRPVGGYMIKITKRC